MAAIFQLRRGSGSVSLVDGELYVNKGPDSLQYAVGEREITLAKLDELNTGSLNLSGDITASNAYFTNNVKIDGKITVGNETGDTLNIVASLSSSLIPIGSKLFDLGSNTNWYKDLYVETISSSFISGSIAGIGNIEIFSASVDNRLDRVEASSSLYDNAMSGSKRIYVSPSGSDSNDGSDPSVPFKTIKAAVASLGAAVSSNIKRYTIFVGSGEYTEQNPIAVPPGVAIVGDTLRTVRLTAANPTKDFFHCHDSNYFYGLRFLDLKHPAFAFSFPSSTATTTISGGSISSINIVHSLSGYVDGTNQDLGIIIEGPNDSGSIATATANVVGGVITQINVVNGGTNYSATEKPHISIPAPLGQRPVISTSPYIQNCSSITGPFRLSDGTKIPVTTPLPYDTSDVDEQGAGGGIRIDGNLVAPTSPLESFVADAFTQVNQGGPGHLVINKGYAQFVSCFTTFCTYGFKVANGGFANISNSVIDFGKYGLVSKTYFPSTYNSGSSLETKTSTVSGFVIDENGAGYTGSIAGVTITGGGASVQATAQATVNANGSIDEIVLLTPGSGYTTQPSVTIATPTGPGAIQATTVNGKALISGVTEILMQLESGSRGVDISSNMILNGIDYLVTDVAQVSGQPNRRKVTTYPAPPSITTNDKVYFHQLSNISTGGLVMEYVGSGVTYNALPKYGGVPVRTREINEFAPGRVFYSTVDNIGNLKIGDFFRVNQLTGEVTIDANAFNLAGLNAIGPFKRNGVGVGVVLQEVSNNTTLLNSQGLYGEDTVPTQYAVHEFVSAFSASLDGRIDALESKSASVDISISNINSFSGSQLTKNSALATITGSLITTASNNTISITNINSYTASLNNAIQLTGSTVSFLGNIVVYGTQSIINSTNLEVADNLIYLNATSSVTNIDFGIIGHYNDGTYRHGGIFRSQTDGAWRVFKNYTSEISGAVNLTDANFALADFYANNLSSSTLSGIGNVTVYSSSVNTRLVNLETKSGSVDSLVANLNLFSASVTSSLTSIYQTTSSLNSYTASVSSSIGWLNQHSASLNTWSGSINNFSGNINTRFDNLQTYTTSVNTKFSDLQTYTSSVNTRLTEIGVVTGSLISSASADRISITNINTFTSSQLTQNTNLSTYTSSVNAQLTQIGVVSGSLILSASAVSSSVWYLNQFSASATASISQLFSTASNHEGRITYIEGVAFGGIDLNAQFAAIKIVTSSLQVATASLQTFTSSANIRLNNLELTSASYNVSISNLNSFTSSQLTQNVNLATITGSLINSASNSSTRLTALETETFNLEVHTASVNTRFTNLASYTGSVNTTTASLNSHTQSTDVRLNNIELFTSSINTTIKNKLNADGVVSGSSQILGNSTIHSGSIGNYQFNSIGIGTAASSVTGELRATGDIVAFYSSDERLKENITPIENAVDKINEMGGYNYDWKEGFETIHSHKGHDLGMIAQEVQSVLPEIVTERETGYLAVDYIKLIPVLIEAIKELSAKIKELENK